MFPKNHPDALWDLRKEIVCLGELEECEIKVWNIDVKVTQK